VWGQPVSLAWYEGGMGTTTSDRLASGFPVPSPGLTQCAIVSIYKNTYGSLLSPGTVQSLSLNCCVSLTVSTNG